MQSDCLIWQLRSPSSCALPQGDSRDSSPCPLSGHLFSPSLTPGMCPRMGQALPSLQAQIWAGMLWPALGTMERGRKAPVHHPLPGLCQPSREAGGRGCPAPQHCRDTPELHLRATAGPHVQNSSSWSARALFCQPSGHAAMHICFPKLRKTGRTLAGDHKDWKFLFIC